MSNICVIWILIELWVCEQNVKEKKWKNVPGQTFERWRGYHDTIGLWIFGLYMRFHLNFHTHTHSSLKIFNFTKISTLSLSLFAIVDVTQRRFTKEDTKISTKTCLWIIYRLWRKFSNNNSKQQQQQQQAQKELEMRREWNDEAEVLYKFL